MLRSLVVATFLFVSLAAGNVASAQTEESRIAFPIAELGSCGSKEECRLYCDEPSHIDACLSFAESNGLMKKEEAQKAREFSAVKGPGGCTGSACRAYCDEEEHEDECFEFAKTRGLVRAAEVSLVQDIKQNGGPGGCTSPKECRTYCSDSANAAECRVFAEKHGLAPRIEDGREDIEKKVRGNPEVIALLEEGKGPGGCSSFEACHAYCDKSENAGRCLVFAKENGLMDEAQYERSKKLLEVEGPGGCKGIACRTYCEDVSHQEACLQFAREQGLISEEEVERVQGFRESIREGGPGGCTDAASCKAFCSEEANREICMQFAKESGFGGAERTERRNYEDGNDVRVMPQRPRLQEAPDDVRRYGPAYGVPEECRENPEACARTMMNAPQETYGDPGVYGTRPPIEGETVPLQKPAYVPEGNSGEPTLDAVRPAEPVPFETRVTDPTTTTTDGAGVLWAVLNFLGVR